MSNGVRRSDAVYVWPSQLFRPSYDIRLVYLDLNHWIYLAKAATGHRDGARHRAALEELRRAAATGRFMFLLSAAHYMEMEGIKSPRQRQDITRVMEELTDFRTLVSRSVLMRLELEAALDALTAPRPDAYAPVELVGAGVLPAFGKVGGLCVRTESGEDVTDKTRLEWPDGPGAFDRWQRESEMLLDRSVLSGPTDEEVPDLRAAGWRPEVARENAERRALQEQDQAQVFATEDGGRWRRGRTRDVVAARFLFIELSEMLGESLAARAVALEEVFPTPEHARRLTDSMPSVDVSITLATARHRHQDPRWIANDIFDIDAMSVAAPYCDIVVTERHACHVLTAAGVEERARVKLLHDLDALAGEAASAIP